MAVKRRRLGLPLAVAVSLLLAACGTGGGTTPQAQTFKCGSQGFSEPEILCEMAKALIEARTPHKVEHVAGLGSSLATHQATVSGDLHMNVTYTGTHFLGTLKMSMSDEWRDPDKVWQYVHDQLLERYGLWVFRPFGFNNVYAVVLKRDVAERHGLKRVSDLAPLAPQWVLGTDQTFPEYPGQGYREFTQVYGFRFKDIKPMDYDLLYVATAHGEVDAAVGYSTDGRIPALDLVVLEDDKQFNPPYHGVLVLRNDVKEKYPEVYEALRPLEGLIDTETMARLNAAVVVDRREPAEVAREFLREKGLLGE